MSPSPRSEVLHIDAVRPYWRNPRRIPDEAVDAVKESLGAFGYVQPIVVDAEGVIIIGHTRYTAMRRLGVTEVEVLRVDLPPAKVKQLRVIDNRTHENAWWDFDLLRAELAEVATDDVMLTLFPEAAPPDDDGGAMPIEKDPDAWGVKPPESTTTEFICPSCYHEFTVDVTLEHVQAGLISKEA